MTNNIDHSLDAAKGDMLLGLLEWLSQIDAGKIANANEMDTVLRFVLDSIGAAQELFFSDTEDDLMSVVERTALARDYANALETRFAVINVLADKNREIAEATNSDNDPS